MNRQSISTIPVILSLMKFCVVRTFLVELHLDDVFKLWKQRRRRKRVIDVSKSPIDSSPHQSTWSQTLPVLFPKVVKHSWWGRVARVEVAACPPRPPEGSGLCKCPGTLGAQDSRVVYKNKILKHLGKNQ